MGSAISTCLGFVGSFFGGGPRQAPLLRIEYILLIYDGTGKALAGSWTMVDAPATVDDLATDEGRSSLGAKVDRVSMPFCLDLLKLHSVTECAAGCGRPFGVISSSIFFVSSNV